GRAAYYLHGRSCWPRGTLRSFIARSTLLTLRSGRSRGSLRSRRSRRPSRSLGALRPGGSLWSGGSCRSPRPWRSLFARNNFERRFELETGLVIAPVSYYLHKIVYYAECNLLRCG